MAATPGKLERGYVCDVCVGGAGLLVFVKWFGPGQKGYVVCLTPGRLDRAAVQEREDPGNTALMPSGADFRTSSKLLFA